MSKNNLLNAALSKRIGASVEESDSIDEAYDKMYGFKNGIGKDKIIELNLDLLIPHPQDPFKPYSKDKLKELAESIEKIGLLNPIIVRSCKDGRYEILAGKNRTGAARLNGMETIKAIVRNVDDDTAVMIITDSNLKHREKLLPSEKAYAYKLQLDAVKNQGKRNDLAENLTSVEIQQKLSRKIVAEINSIKDNEIQRYIRLTNLIPELLELIDSDEIPLMAGVDLSYIDGQAQTETHKYFFILNNGDKLDLKASAAIKEAFKENKMPITADTIPKILNREQKKQKQKPFSINRNKFKDFADKLPDDKELENLFIEFLKAKYNI